jgi:hypothetical protein
MGRIQYALYYSGDPLKTDVLSHEVKFEVITTGNVTPDWKLKYGKLVIKEALECVKRPRW